MTHEILSAANYLMSIKGSTTTLDVKNYVHQQHVGEIGFVLTQREVSLEMKDLSKQHAWKESSNGTYITYSNPIAPVPQATATVSAVNGHSTRVNPADPMVAYLRTNKSFYLTGADKNEVRRNLFALAVAFNLDITYDDINYCTQEYYNKHHK